MKVYISSDIEGTSGITHWDETDYDRGGRWYDYFREAMSREVAAAVEGAKAAGAEDILVKDAHDLARNILPTLLPAGIRINRGWSRDPFSMMAGLDESFDAAAMTGYHAPAHDNGNPLSHTMITAVDEVRLNGARCSEFMLNSYIAAMLGVPVVFLSGDRQLCEEAKALIPALTTVAVSEGSGNSSTSLHPTDAQNAIREGMQKALSGSLAACKIELPEYFEIEVRYKEHAAARKNGYYPGARQVNEKTIAFETEEYFEVLRFAHFVL